MRHLFRDADLPCALALAATLAGIALGGTLDWRLDWRGGAQWSDTSDVTGGIGPAPAATRLQLSEEQRGRIFAGIMRLPAAPVVDVAVPQSTYALPRSVELQELPASVTKDVPVVRGYKFVKLEDRVLLVSPLDRTVAAEMPRYRLIVD